MQMYAATLHSVHCTAAAATDDHGDDDDDGRVREAVCLFQVRVSKISNDQIAKVTIINGYFLKI
jgi:hypothetical protein